MLDRTIRRNMMGVLVTKPIQVTATRLISKLRKVEPLKMCHKGIDSSLKREIKCEPTSKRKFVRIEMIKLGLKLKRGWRS